MRTETGREQQAPASRFAESRAGERTSASSRTTLRSLFQLLSGHAVKVVVLGLSGVFVPRILGATNYGVLAAVMAIVTMVQVTSTLGLGQTAIRFIPPLWHRDRGAALQLGSTVWIIRLIAAPVFGVLGSFWIWLSIGSAWSPPILLALGLLCALLPATEAARGLFIPIDEAGKFVGIEILYVSLRLPLVVGSYLAFGLSGVFVSLAVLQGFLSLFTTSLLLRTFPLARRHFGLSSLVVHLRFGLSGWFEAMLGIVQVQFGIYAVAIWVAPSEAGILAVAMMLFVIARGPMFAVILAVAPGLAVIETEGDTRRLRAWGELIFGASTALYSMVLVGWTALGSRLVPWVFGPEFLPVFPTVTLLLSSMVFLVMGLTCHQLLLTRRRPGAALGVTALYSACILGGLLFVLPDAGPRVVVEIAWIYLGAGVVFAIASFLALRIRDGGLALSASWGSVFALPALVYVPASLRLEGLTQSLAVGLVGLVYLVLLAWQSRRRGAEIRILWRTLRQRYSLALAGLSESTLAPSSSDPSPDGGNKT